MDPSDKKMPDDAGQPYRSVRDGSKDGVWLTLFLFGLSYPGVVLIREVIGQRGFPLFPVLFLPVVLAISTLLLASENTVQAKRWWPRVKHLWFVTPGVIGTLLPLIGALIWPFPILAALPRGIPTVIAFGLIFGGVAAWLARQRRRHPPLIDE